MVTKPIIPLNLTQEGVEPAPRTAGKLLFRLFLAASSALLAVLAVTGLLLLLNMETARAQVGNQPSLSAGRYHTCYLNAANEFICWGDESNFPNSGAPDFEPVLITNTVAVSAGDYATCALKIDGSIQCWSPDSRIVSEVITTTSNKQVSVGTSHACAVDAANEIHCWGDLTGLSDVYSQTVTLVSAGNENDCAIRLSNNRVVCWGVDDWQSPNASYSYDDLSVGPDHACGIRTTGELACWGNILFTPPTGSNYIAIESGSDYACALDSSMNISCWGSADRPPVDTQDSFLTFSAGFLHACALRTAPGGHTLSCWGDNEQLQAPQMSLSPTSIPEFLPLNRTFSQTFTPAGGTEPYTLTLQSSVPGLALTNFDLSGSPNTTGSHVLSLLLEENFSASSLPLELTPLVTSFNTTVQDPTTTVTVNANLTQAPVGSPIEVSVTIIDLGTPTLTGNVTIVGTDNATSVEENRCTATVSNNQASCTLGFTFAGSKTFTAIYNGDTFYLPSPGGTAGVSITPVVLYPTLTAGNDFTCGTDNTGRVNCWGKNDSDQATPPGGLFSVISAGDSHACGRSLNGRLSCWGWNGWGVSQPPLTYDFLSVTSGALHSCGLRYNRSVVCWGFSENNRTTPPSGVTFSSISAGDNHTCGMTTSGTVQCWGTNGSQQSNPPTGSFTQVSSGGAFTCGIRSSDNALQCWGASPISLDTSGYKAVEAGRAHVCAIDLTDHLTCWGSNTYGQTTVPNPNQTFSTVSAGATHTCAVRSDGFLNCWGEAVDGQAPVIHLTPATMLTTDVDSPFSLTIDASGGRENLYTFSYTGNWPPGLQLDANSGQISNSPTQPGVFNYTIRAAERNLTPAFIGEQSYTQIIRSDVAVQITTLDPTSPMAGLPVKATVQVSETPGSQMGATPTLTVTVTADDGTLCNAVLQNGSATCALFFTTPGAKNIQASYVGDAYFKPGTTPAQSVLTVAPLLQSPKIQTSPAVTLVHLADGSIACPGSPPSSACQNLDFPARYPAISVGETQACVLQTNGKIDCQPLDAGFTLATPPNGSFTALSVGKNHACAIDPFGSLVCWGDNSAGQAVPPAGNYIAVSASDDYTCGVLVGGSLDCWGNPPPGSPPPTAYTAVSSGPNHSCALISTQQAFCWGDNGAGQSTAPAGQFSSISVGLAHSCAVSTDGKIVCWGDNGDAQSRAPYGLFTTLSAADDHTCALRPGPRLTCWGGNDQGEAPAIIVNPIGGPSILSATLSTPTPIAQELASQVTIPALKYWEHGFYPAGGVKPYQAGLSSGALPGGIEMRVLLSPAGTIMYGTPQDPGVYPFVVFWEDAASTPLMAEEPYTITVTGVDLQVSIIPDDPTIALFNNAFSYDVVLSNLTDLATPDVTLIITLPEGLSDIQTSGLPGCVQTGQEIRCDINTIAGHSSLTLTIKGQVTAGIGEQLSIQAQAASNQANWPEVVPGNNQAQSTVTVAQFNPVFLDPFPAAPVNPAWTGGAVITAPSGVTYLGDFTSSSALYLHLADLPPHQSIIVSFDLYVIGPWAGTAGTPPGRWQFSMDAQPALVDTTFSNLADKFQNYPSNHPTGSFPWRTGSDGIDLLTYPGIADTRYQFHYRTLHTADTLDLLFESLDLPPGARWGIDQVKVVLDWGQYRLQLPVVSK